jgi:peptidoglycan/LPS O-acetylase OafA/YrhL
MMVSLYAVALPLLIAYSTIYLATAPLPRPAFLPGGDYSYGIYIYGAPIQQAVQLISPRIPWVNFILSAPLVFAFAVASWELVEKPMLSLKRGFNRHRFGASDPSATAQSRQWNQNVAA